MSSGAKTALDQMLAVAADAAPADADGQNELFDPAEFEVDMPMPMAPAERPAERPGPQGGRPKGARNKSTEQLRQYILGRYKHPLIVMAEMWSRTPEDLAREMKLYDYKIVSNGDGAGSSIEEMLATGEAARLQRDLLIAALPYLAQKLPIAIEQKGNSRGVLVLGDFKMQVNNNAGGLPLVPTDEAEMKMIDQSPLGGDPT